MLTLYTGKPGSSKTLNLIKFIAENSSFKDRPIYYYNIEFLHPEKVDLNNSELKKSDLTCDHLNLADTKRLKIYDYIQTWQQLTKEEVNEWYKLPRGSVILIDEVQFLWRVRTREPMPNAVQQLETHRHLGHDLFFTSQYPMQLDKGVRELIQVHKHFTRNFGIKLPHFKQWEDLNDPIKPHSELIDSGTAPLDKNYFGLYQSAEVHTHDQKIPKKLIYVVAFIVCFVIFSVYAVGRITRDRVVTNSDVSPDHVTTLVKTSDTTLQKTSGTIYMSQFIPRVDEIPYSAEFYDSLITPVTFPKVTGCLQYQTPDINHCTCTTQQGTTVNYPVSVCMNYIANGSFDFSKPDFDYESHMAEFLPDGTPCCGGDSSSSSTSNSSGSGQQTATASQVPPI